MNYHQKLFPKAIMHIDGDCFFVACELTKFPELVGKPVVTGLERGIVSALSYEAKACGVKRAMPLHMARQLCPQLVALSSDFHLYQTYASRMVAILKRYTQHVEPYSIDECFIDITELGKHLGSTYEEIARRMKRDLESELGITFSVGLSTTKTLAKLASAYVKPNGFTVMYPEDVSQYLSTIAIADVWGIGSQTAQKYRDWGIMTAEDLRMKDTRFIERHFSKPHHTIHAELNGISILNISEHRDMYQSMSKTKTFTKNSNRESYVFAELVRNTEDVCKTLRKRNLTAKKVSLFLKTDRFTYASSDFQLPYGITTSTEIMKLIRQHFDTLFEKGTVYRATGVTVSQLSPKREKTLNLFQEDLTIAAHEAIAGVMDRLEKKFGHETIVTASGLFSENKFVKRSKNIPHHFVKRLSIPTLGFVR